MIATFLQACLGFLIGVVQCALIYVGLRRMGQASDERRDQHEEAMRALEVQHEALQELITRTAK